MRKMTHMHLCGRCNRPFECHRGGRCSMSKKSLCQKCFEKFAYQVDDVTDYDQDDLDELCGRYNRRSKIGWS